MEKLPANANSFSHENELEEMNFSEEYAEDMLREELLDENEELYKWLGILLGIIWILSIIFY